MKTRIDLLPESRKLLLAKKKRFKEVIKQEILFILPIILFASMLVGIIMILKAQDQGMKAYYDISDNQGNYKDLKLYEDKTREINKKTSTIIKFKKNHFNWSGVISEIIGYTPDGIILSTFSTKNYRIFIVGKSDERGNLISFKDKIENSRCFENITFPVSNIVSKDNIDFQIDFNVKKECLIKQHDE